MVMRLRPGIFEESLAKCTCLGERGAFFFCPLIKYLLKELELNKEFGEESFKGLIAMALQNIKLA